MKAIEIGNACRGLLAYQAQEVRKNLQDYWLSFQRSCFMEMMIFYFFFKYGVFCFNFYGALPDPIIYFRRFRFLKRRPKKKKNPNKSKDEMSPTSFIVRKYNLRIY